MSLLPAEILLAAAAILTVAKVAAEQQFASRKPIRVRADDDVTTGARDDEQEG